jgi:hypothetical protein
MGHGDQAPVAVSGGNYVKVEVFGEVIGKHARSAGGIAKLPLGIPVEIEMVLEVE